MSRAVFPLADLTNRITCWSQVCSCQTTTLNLMLLSMTATKAVSFVCCRGRDLLSGLLVRKCTSAQDLCFAFLHQLTKIFLTFKCYFLGRSVIHFCPLSPVIGPPPRHVCGTSRSLRKRMVQAHFTCSPILFWWLMFSEAFVWQVLFALQSSVDLAPSVVK